MVGKSRVSGVSIGLGAAILYLSAHAITGQQGLVAYMDSQAKERALIAERDALLLEQAALEVRAARMRTGQLDADYLDELARRNFAAAAPDEAVFLIE